MYKFFTVVEELLTLWLAWTIDDGIQLQGLSYRTDQDKESYINELLHTIIAHRSRIYANTFIGHRGGSLLDNLSKLL